MNAIGTPTRDPIHSGTDPITVDGKHGRIIVSEHMFRLIVENERVVLVCTMCDGTPKML